MLVAVLMARSSPLTTNAPVPCPGSFEEASKVYAEAAALSRTFLPKGIAALYNNLAASHMAAGDHAAGLAACSAAIAAQPYSPKGYERRAKCHTVSLRLRISRCGNASTSRS